MGGTPYVLKGDTMKTLLKGTIFGGLTLFFWGWISWMVIPWHNATLNALINEPLVEQVLIATAPEKAVYLLPSGEKSVSPIPPAEKEAHRKAAMGKWEKGFSAFLVMNPQGTGSMPMHMVKGLLTQMLAALLGTWLLVKAKLSGLGERVLFVVVFALAAGVVTHVPYWNWWGFPANYTLVSIADLIVGWALAGAVISGFALEK